MAKTSKMAIVRSVELVTTLKTKLELDGKMSNTSLIESMFAGRYLDQVLIGSTVFNLSLCSIEANAGTPPVYELRIYSSVLLANSKDWLQSPPQELTAETIQRAISAASITLVVGYKIQTATLMDDGVLVLAFEGGTCLSVSNKTDFFEDSWVLQEPDFSDNPVQTAFHCSNAGIVDEYTVGALG